MPVGEEGASCQRAGGHLREERGLAQRGAFRSEPERLQPLLHFFFTPAILCPHLPPPLSPVLPSSASAFLSGPFVSGLLVVVVAGLGRMA